MLLSLAATFMSTNFALFIMVKKNKKTMLLFFINLQLISTLAYANYYMDGTSSHSRKGKHVLINTFGKHVDFTM